MKILIDNGHGMNTAGKRSPNGSLLEYRYCREIAASVVRKLKAEGYDAQLITPEQEDISITTRCKRVNSICAKYGAKNCLLVSIHNNAAASDGKWHTARGFSVYVSLNASERSKQLAKTFTKLAVRRELMGNRSFPVELYWTQNLGICRETNCPAVLTENMFMDNEKDVAFLLSDKGKEAIVNLHVDAIKQYISTI